MKQLKEGIFLCQTKYVKDMLKSFDMVDSKPIKNPTTLNRHLDLNEEGKSVVQKVFRLMIGSLLYLCMYARFQANPMECHLMAVKKIFSYLVHTPNLGFGIPRAPLFI
jgi:hypothetical protein